MIHMMYMHNLYDTQPRPSTRDMFLPKRAGTPRDEKFVAGSCSKQSHADRPHRLLSSAITVLKADMPQTLRNFALMDH